MEKKKLPDTPWHISYAKKDEDDPRRHMARCVHKRGKICMNLSNIRFMRPCGGSAHCMYYAETLLQAEKVREETMSVEEEQIERANKYRLSKIKEWEKLSEIGPEELNRRYGKALECPICHEKLKKEKRCEYCGFNLSGSIERLPQELVIKGSNKDDGGVKQQPPGHADGEADQKNASEEPASANVMIGDLVSHKMWGKGTVTNIQRDKIEVQFGKEKKVFQNPAAFDKGYLKTVGH